MDAKMWNVDDVKPYEQNPRLNDDAVDAVVASIREFGFRQPIVVDAEGVIIVGHTRWKAAKKMGMLRVPVHVAGDLPPEKAKAYRIADNQTASLSEWDMDKLPAELLGLKELDYDLNLLGFGDQLAGMLDPGVQEGLTDPDAVPEQPDEATTQPGDLYILGDHRLLCGDSSKPEDLDRLLAGAAIHLVNTDPPYNVKVEPRSNNAIAAGLSSFAAPAASPGFHADPGRDVHRNPNAGHATHKKLRANGLAHGRVALPIKGKPVTDGRLGQSPTV